MWSFSSLLNEGTKLLSMREKVREGGASFFGKARAGGESLPVIPDLGPTLV